MHAVYLVLVLHFLRKVLGKAFARDERAPGKDRYSTLRMCREDFAFFRKCMYKEMGVPPGLMESADAYRICEELATNYSGAFKKASIPIIKKAEFYSSRKVLFQSTK
jgi:hypothetical protein